LLSPQPPLPLFPYTTLFRSPSSNLPIEERERSNPSLSCTPIAHPDLATTLSSILSPNWLADGDRELRPEPYNKEMNQYASTKHRSEEHTSELQSRVDIVCRL